MASLWTKEIPKVPGYYWRRRENPAIDFRIVMFGWSEPTEKYKSEFGYWHIGDKEFIKPELPEKNIKEKQWIYWWKKIDLTDDEKDGIFAFVINE